MEELTALHYSTLILLARARIRLNCDDIVATLKELNDIIAQQYNNEIQKAHVDAKSQTLSRLTRCYQRIETEYAARTTNDIQSIDWSVVAKFIGLSSQHGRNREELRTYLQSQKKKREAIFASIRAEHDVPLSDQEVVGKIAEQIVSELQSLDKTTLNLISGPHHEMESILRVMRLDFDNLFKRL